MVFAGGKFNTPAESRYSPVEGEALGDEAAEEAGRGEDETTCAAADDEGSVDVVNGDSDVFNIDDDAEDDLRLDVLESGLVGLWNVGGGELNMGDAGIGTPAVADMAVLLGSRRPWMAAGLLPWVAWPGAASETRSSWRRNSS